jgi:hypothetical protein
MCCYCITTLFFVLVFLSSKINENAVKFLASGPSPKSFVVDGHYRISLFAEASCNIFLTWFAVAW